ncbi:MAG: hypothetical protein QW063_00505 [Candidatus Nanoarchaeia archaeon]
MKRGQGQEKPISLLGVSLPLLIIFFIIVAFIFIPDLGQKIVEIFNVKVLAPIGISPISIPEFGKPVAEKVGLNATITIVPDLPACTFEKLFFSALNSHLPTGIEWGSVSCIWDFDISKDTSNDGIADNDIDSSQCEVATENATIKSSQTVKLILKTQQGVTDSAESTITTTLLCDKAQLQNKVVPSGDVTSLILGKNWTVQSLHIKIRPEAVDNITNITINVIGSSAAVDYSFEGIIYDEFLIYDQNLEAAINSVLEKCKATTCSVNLIWSFGSGSARIIDVHIPYTVNL